MSDLIGWDVGGAHLKAVRVENTTVRAVVQLPCTLWLGPEHLDRALDDALRQLGPVDGHAVTMTGELVDYFPDRAEGVRRLAGLLSERLPNLRIWAGPLGFIAPERASSEVREVASANWLASVTWTARRLPQGLFADMGSTTTDLVPFAEGASRHRGFTDAERLAEAELVYTGAVRTPSWRLPETIPFAGRIQGIMAEYFATIADAHRLRGVLPDGIDLHDTPTIAANPSRRALPGSHESSDAISAMRIRRSGVRWPKVSRAGSLSNCAACRAGVFQGRELDREAPVLGAGAGRFVLHELAAALGRPYRDFAEIVEGAAETAGERRNCCPCRSRGITCRIERLTDRVHPVPPNLIGSIPAAERAAKAQVIRI